MLNEKLLQNIARCYKGESDGVDNYIRFAKLFINRNIEEMQRLEDYLDTILKINDEDEKLKNTLRDIIENHNNEPHLLFDKLNKNTELNRYEKPLKEALIKRGYYAEKIEYNCPNCGLRINAFHIPHNCPQCEKPIIPKISLIKRDKEFYDFYAPISFAFSESERNQGDIKGDESTQDKSTESDIYDIASNPLFNKRGHRGK